MQVALYSDWCYCQCIKKEPILWLKNSSSKYRFVAAKPNNTELNSFVALSEADLIAPFSLIQGLGYPIHSLTLLGHRGDT